MNPILVNYKIRFNELATCFINDEEKKLVLKPQVGNGSLHIVNLEHGLQARLWDCRFNKSMELSNDMGTNNPYFNLAFFSKSEGLQLANENKVYNERPTWDTVLISSTTNFKIFVKPAARVQCLSISFSKRWLNDNFLNTAKMVCKFKKILAIVQSCSLMQFMTIAEKKRIVDLIASTPKKFGGSFFVKSAILKIVSDFFLKIQTQKIPGPNNCPKQKTLADIKDLVEAQIREGSLNVKKLAHQFCKSESTLKRHFKKVYGINIAGYFTLKKMEYAKQLMQDDKRTPQEAASLLGYQNVNYFLLKLQKITAS